MAMISVPISWIHKYFSNTISFVAINYNYIDSQSVEIVFFSAGVSIKMTTSGVGTVTIIIVPDFWHFNQDIIMAHYELKR